jgi:putative endonuclease
MAVHNQTGRMGEAMAVEYLSKEGYAVLHQNWRHARLEVDVIANKDNVLHFIEVKTRRTEEFGLPEDAVDKKKIKNLIDAAEEFLYQYPNWKRIQFDILAITILKDKPAEYFFIEDVYL